MKSTVPFSELYVIDPENPPPEKDYDEYFKNLKEGITGKEALEGNPVAVWEMQLHVIILLVQILAFP